MCTLCVRYNDGQHLAVAVAAGLDHMALQETIGEAVRGLRETRTGKRCEDSPRRRDPSLTQPDWCACSSLPSRKLLWCLVHPDRRAR